MDLTSKEVLTFKEACLYAGMKESYMYKLTSTGRIPHSKPQGGKLFFKRSDLEIWLLQNPARTADQIEMAAANHVTFSGKGRVKL
jgi:excisionase family DNA binding protein